MASGLARSLDHDVLELLQAHGSLPATCAVQRISFSEITKKAVDDALAAPRDIDMPLVRAQQARTETQTDPRP